jgi:DNA-binding MarR family transcriptional regulator
VQRVVKDGLAERYPSADDGRVVMVKVTPEGRRRHAVVAERRAIAMERIIGSFAPEERAQLADLLERLNNAVDDVVNELNAGDDNAG